MESAPLEGCSMFFWCGGTKAPYQTWRGVGFSTGSTVAFLAWYGWGCSPETSTPAQTAMADCCQVAIRPGQAAWGMNCPNIWRKPSCWFGVPRCFYWKSTVQRFSPSLNEAKYINRFTRTCTNLTAPVQGHSWICQHAKHMPWRETTKRKHLGLEIGYCTPEWDGFTHIIPAKTTIFGGVDSSLPSLPPPAGRLTLTQRSLLSSSIENVWECWVNTNVKLSECGLTVRLKGGEVNFFWEFGTV